ncbi:TetR/AcrR family transcriptional regulator [Marinitenerispora sediminis]|uniref:TetR family transcriptional regulator n=1 Tax=Marinitenerispora sediminis TaxID=1931232 RepID=A0A368SY02_9ACTN|nr:TetR/AcrR family transcriptional regulator [Marinitenerispora sediminis]RCV47524.1 TetR family transcriptional regulator [Marinitenerispora sediminis]RCV47586.1 TetR family transcriptional regulator [Marinitenerispora sediminis]RCV48189.1 TetR family transcriptional regulator [Marinitenerispora sediminis]
MRSKNQPSGRKSDGGQGDRSFIEQARRAQIIAAAIGAIAELGFAGASLARIAERAGISKGVISYHFAGKDELMEQVVERIYTDAAEHTAPLVAEQATVAASVRAHILGAAEYMRGHRDQLIALGEIFNNLRTPDGKPRFGAHSSEPLYQALEALYRAGQASGEFRAFDTRVMAVTHQAAVDTMFGYWTAYPEHDLEAHARQLADLLLNGVRAPGAD